MNSKFKHTFVCVDGINFMSELGKEMIQTNTYSTEKPYELRSFILLQQQKVPLQKTIN